jgi:alcohol dehydrogenase class IV
VDGAVSDQIKTLNRPRRVLYGPNSSAQVATVLGDLAGQVGTALLVGDRAVVELGLAAPAIAALEAAGWQVEVFDEIEAEPQVAVAAAVLERLGSVGATAVVGIGGGSAIDLAKIAAGVAGSAAELEPALAGEVALRVALPLIAIPTTSGTGAECTDVAPIARGDAKLLLRGPGLMPDVAVLDPELTMGLPRAVTAATGMDALAHACEAYVSTNATALTDVYALAAVRAVAGSLRECCAENPSIQERGRLLEGAHLAGTALNAGVVVGHSVAYAVAARTHLPHGVTTGTVLPYFLLFDRPGSERRLAELAAAALGRPDATDADLISWLAATIADVGLPGSLAEAGIERGDLAAMADEVIALYPRPNNPIALEPGRILTFLEFAYDGDLDAAKAASQEVTGG